MKGNLFIVVSINWYADYLNSTSVSWTYVKLNGNYVSAIEICRFVSLILFFIPFHLQTRTSDPGEQEIIFSKIHNRDEVFGFVNLNIDVSNY